MSFVKVSRAADIVYNYDENGVARVPILVGECKDCALESLGVDGVHSFACKEIEAVYIFFFKGEF